jgi:hypothetical protein
MERLVVVFVAGGEGRSGQRQGDRSKEGFGFHGGPFLGVV